MKIDPTPTHLLSLLAFVALVAGCEGRSPRAGVAPSDQAPEAPRVAETRTGSEGGGSLVELDLSKGVPEEVQAPLFGAAAHRSHLDLVRTLRGILDGRPPKGIFVRLGTATVGLARAQEIGALLGAARKQRVPVVCHADEYDNATLMLAASGCSKIWLSPAGGVEAVGIAAQLLYANKFLESHHIAVDYLQVGKYKGAEEPFTRDGPSPEARESLVGTLRGMRASWISTIAEGRGKPALEGRVEDGPFSPEDAQKEGLVDALGYLDEALDDAKKQAGVEQVVSRFGGGDAPPGASRGVVSLLRAIGGGGGHGGSARVAVIPAIGPITMSAGRSLVPIGASEGINEHDLGRVLTRLTSEPAVKAVLIRIDSPGGSALASDLLWKKLMKLREKKTLVFSVGGMAASGGYYLACTGKKIVAEPTSIVGSIGVVGGKLAIGKALEEFGVHAETIAAAPDPEKAARSSYMSPFAPWDDPTRKKVLASMTSIYDLFLRRVAEGRGSVVEKVAGFAEGRIFGGVEAKDRGLVDEIGGFNDALKLTLKLADLADDTPFEVIGDTPGLFDLIDVADPTSEERAASGVADGARRLAGDALTAPWIAAFPEVGAFVGSMSPMLQGEQALAAMPFGLSVR